MALPAALLVAASYLLGSVPFAWIVTQLVKGVDVRTIGSGNVGATNASRVLGQKWFLVVFALDAAKGALPVLVAAPLAGLSGDAATRLAMGCGLAAIVGHVFPVFLRFRGGKGVATGAGVLAALAWLPTVCALGVFVICLFLFRYVSLASILACASLVPLAWTLGGPGEGERSAFISFVAVAVILLHRKNVARIAAGTEPRVFQKKETAGA